MAVNDDLRSFAEAKGLSGPVTDELIELVQDLTGQTMAPVTRVNHTPNTR